MSSLLATRRLMHVILLMGLIGLMAVLTDSWVPATALVPLVGMTLVALVEALMPLPRWAFRTTESAGIMLREDETTVDVDMGFVVMPYNLSLREQFPDGMEISPHSQKPMAWDGRTVHGRYKLHAIRRGDRDMGNVRVARTSMLGLFERVVDLPASTPTTVLPVTAKQQDLRLRTTTLSPEGIPNRNSRRGPGDSFYALREYMPGDAMGDINWKATARHGRPITNEFLPDEPARYLIYVDTRDFGSEVGKEDAFERTLEMSAALVEGLLGVHAHVGLVMLAGRARFKVPAHGAVHARKIRRMILMSQPGAEAPLQQLVEAGAPVLPRRTSAILVTPNLYEPTLQATLTYLRAHHGHVLLLVPGFPEPPGHRETAERAAGALLNTDQAAVLADLRPYTDGAAQWPPDEPIAVTLGHLGLVGRGGVR